MHTVLRYLLILVLLMGCQTTPLTRGENLTIPNIPPIPEGPLADTARSLAVLIVTAVILISLLFILFKLAKKYWADCIAQNQPTKSTPAPKPSAPSGVPTAPTTLVVTEQGDNMKLNLHGELASLEEAIRVLTVQPNCHIHKETSSINEGGKEQRIAKLHVTLDLADAPDMALKSFSVTKKA